MRKSEENVLAYLWGKECSRETSAAHSFPAWDGGN